MLRDKRLDIEKIKTPRAPVRLAEGLQDNPLDPRALERGWQALERFGKRLRGFEAAHVRAVATSAVCQARNASTFLVGAKARLGFPIGERIKLLQEEIAAKLNEQTNSTLFTLTMVTVLALPINIIAGFFGMNVGGVPLAGDPHGFWVLVALVALVATFTVLAGRWAFRKRGDY